MIESNATLSFLVLAIHFENSIFDVTSIFANEYNRVVGAVRWPNDCTIRSRDITYLGKEIWKQVYVSAQRGHRWRCSECGRPWRNVRATTFARLPPTPTSRRKIFRKQRTSRLGVSTDESGRILRVTLAPLPRGSRARRNTRRECASSCLRFERFSSNSISFDVECAFVTRSIATQCHHHALLP